jgi:hypothetical protein
MPLVEGLVVNERKRCRAADRRRRRGANVAPFDVLSVKAVIASVEKIDTIFPSYSVGGIVIVSAPSAAAGFKDTTDGSAVITTVEPLAGAVKTYCAPSRSAAIGI